MTITVGDAIPSIQLKKLGMDGLEDVDIAYYITGRKVLIFAVPGAYTPTCAEKHLPGYIENADAIMAKGIDEIICVAVNDPFVMNHWGEEAGAAGKVTMLPDGNGALTQALGMELDGSGFGLGFRSLRYSMVVDDGTVIDLQVEDDPGGVSVSGADICLAKL